MRGASGQSLAQAELALAPLCTPPGRAEVLADELFALVDALDAAPAVMRVLANPNHSAAAKGGLVAGLMAGHDAAAVTFGQQLVAGRWSHDRDLADAVEQLAISARLTVIEQADEASLETFEDQLFQFDRLCVSRRDVRLAVADADATPAARVRLVAALVGEQMAPAGLALLSRLVAAPRGRSLAANLLMLETLAAERRHRLVAMVTAAAPLSPAQQTRLGEILAAAYGHQIQLNITFDRAVVGGLRIHIGDDVVDATVLARLAALRRAVAS